MFGSMLVRPLESKNILGRVNVAHAICRLVMVMLCNIGLELQGALDLGEAVTLTRQPSTCRDRYLALRLYTAKGIVVSPNQQ